MNDHHPVGHTTKEERDKERCVVVAAKCCHSVILAIVDQPQFMTKNTKAEIADLAMEGHSVLVMTAEQVRHYKFGCKCRKVIEGANNDFLTKEKSSD